MANEKRLIDADAFVLEELYKRDEIYYRNTFDSGVRRVLKEIFTAPTVDAVEVVHGRWITERTPVETEFECSECGFLLIDADSHAKMEYNYCPNCGAKMDGDGNDEH